MGNTNWKSVLLGGVLAGIVFTVLGIIARMTYLPKVWIPALEKEATAVFFNLLFIMWVVLGILAVWLYSAIRPRYGAGVKTAAMAGLFVWVIGELFPDIQMTVFGLYPVNMFVAGGLTNLVSFVAGTIIGAWVYREHPPEKV